jgi:hypothetical protein
MNTTPEQIAELRSYTDDQRLLWHDSPLVPRIIELLPGLLDDLDILRGAIAAQDERNDSACLRVGSIPRGCDTPEALADEVLALRAEVARLTQERDDAYTDSRMMQARLQRMIDQRAETLHIDVISGLQAEVARLRQQLTDVYATSQRLRVTAVDHIADAGKMVGGEG